MSGSRVGHHDPEWMAKDLAAIEFASAPGQDVLCSGLNVNGRAETPQVIA
jgi:hypothetical protein